MRSRSALAAVLAAAFVLALSGHAAAQVACPSPIPVVEENQCSGSASNAWRLTDPDPAIAGFATQTSVDRGEDVVLKIGRSGAPPGTTAADIHVFRIGYYGGAGGRFVATASQDDVTVNNDQDCGSPDPTTGLLSCASWAPTYTIPGSSLSTSGVYLVRIQATDTGWDNHIIFVVRDDERAPKSDILFELPISTYEAYNHWGGKSLYDFNSTGANTVSGGERAVKVSFDRPFINTTEYYNDWFTRVDFTLVYWLEQQGYDVAYTDDVHTHTDGAEVLDHGAIVLGGHDEYWSGEQYSAIEAGRDSGVGIASFGADQAYWKVRFEDAGRTLVDYKTVQGSIADGSAGTNDWGPDGVEGTADDALGADGIAGTEDDRPENATTTFRDNGAPPGDPNAPAGGRVGPDRPENSLFGSMYMGDRDGASFPLRVPEAQAGEFAADPIWRHTNVQGGGASIGSSLVGWEWDSVPTQPQYLSHQPPGVKRLTESEPEGNWLQDEGRVYATEPPPGQPATATAVKYTAASGALVFAAGTDQWGWGLGPHWIDKFHNPANGIGEFVDESDPRIEQATANVFADMGIDPHTPSGIVLDTESSTLTASFSAKPSPAAVGEEVSFDASGSTDIEGQIVRYEWDLNDDGTYEVESEAPTASRSYATPGTRQIHLRVTDDHGSTDTVERPLTVHSGPSGPYSEAVLGSEGLAHYWRLGESSGSTFADSVGTADATNFGATLGAPGAVAEDSDTAASFEDPSSSAAPVDLSGTNKVTVEFWLNWDQFANDDALALELTDNFNQHDGGILVDPDAPEAGGRFSVAIGREGSRNNAYFERPSAGEYHHYAFVLDTTAPAAEQVVPYVDGVPVPYVKTASGTGAGNFADALLHFMSRNGSQLFGAGDLDELAIYTRKLTPGEIAEHFELGVSSNLRPKPSFTVTPSPAAVEETVHFDASASTDPDGQIVRYEWDLNGDGIYEIESEAPTADRSYESAGTHQVRLRVTDDQGETGTLERSLTVYVSPSTPYPDAILGSEGLAHYWRLGESSGSTFADSVGTADATNFGATLGAPGALTEDSDAAAGFTGPSSVAAPVDLSGTNKVTVEFWLNWDQFANDDAVALELTNNFNQHDGGILVDPDAPEAGGRFSVAIGRNASRNNAFFERPSAGEYHHYAFVLDATAPAAEQVVPYLDGVPVPYVKTASGTGAGNFANALLHFMSRNGSQSQLFGSGDLDELAIYTRKLSPAEIKEHYRLGVDPDIAPKASFTMGPSPATVEEEVSFDASASGDSDGQIVRYEWDLNGDGIYEIESEAPTAGRSYESAGTHQVRLRVTDDRGKRDTLMRPVTIHAGPNAPYAQAVLGSEGLAHYWRLGETSGSVFADSVGTADATSSGATLGEPSPLAEDLDSAARFGGSASAAAAVDLSGANKVTVEFWLNWDQFANDDALALELTDNFNQHDGGILVDPNAPDAGGRFSVAIGREGSRNNAFFERPSAGEYHHYAFVLDTTAPAAEQVVPYVDGVPVPYVKTASGTGAGNFADALLHFMSRNGSQLFGAGQLDELAIYTRDLTPAEIKEHYRLGIDPNIAPIASFTMGPSPATVEEEVSFDASASGDSDGQIVRYEWDLNGDGEYEIESDSPTTTRSYETAGTHQVGLRVTDDRGKRDTLVRPLTVHSGPSGPYAQAVLGSEGLAHYWRLGETSGSIFADIAGGADATNSGATLGEPGALAEDPDPAAGFGGSASAAAAVDLSGANQLTVEFWLNWDQFANDDALALELTDNFNQHDGGILVDPNAPDAGGRFSVAIGREGSRNNAFFERPSAGQYHHYALVLDTTAPAAEEIIPYVDGVAVPYIKTASGTGAGNFANALLHFMSRNSSELFGTGDLDDLAIYTRRLSPEEIQEHHSLGVEPGGS